MNIQIIVATILFAPIIGGLIAGIDRIITARMQHRVGPPVLQPFYDVLKLFGKENIAVTNDQSLYAVLYLVFNIITLVMFTLKMDLLLILFMLLLAVASLVMGAMSANSPFSKIGAQRELIAILAYEPILISSVIGMYFVTGSFNIGRILQSDRMLFLDLPLLFIAFTYVLTIKLRKSPFDFSTSHHGHQELVKGLTIEYSGPSLAMIEIAHWYETVLLLLFAGLFFANNLYVAAAAIAICYFAEILVDNIAARLTWQIMLKSTWIPGLMIAVVNMVWVYIKYHV